MSSSFFFLHADKNSENHALISGLEEWASDNKTQVYVIDGPLGDDRYEYNHTGSLIILIPKRKIALVDFSRDENDFAEFVEDFIEDLGSISDKFRYKEAIGRPRKWRDQLIFSAADGFGLSMNDLLDATEISDAGKQRTSELLVSLLTGSINDIKRVRVDLPENLLDQIKRKIILFDGDQTRFVYEDIEKKTVTIQGLSGTGKTELLLHKLKDIYVNNPEAKVVFTCHNRILADNLRRRIPEFFNFMKVEKQIAWNEQLWCMHAWGSGSDPNSGTYRYLCYFYGLTFHRYSYTMTFDVVCREAIKQLQQKGDKRFAFDYILIDESQDFSPSFIELCQMCTKEVVFVAGDVFQSIFDESIVPSISPDYLLSKCYRTDPKTLMFAHALGMGLFEAKKLRWLDDEEWRTCGYKVEKTPDEGFYRLRREPLRRFEDIEAANVEPVTIVESSNAAQTISEIINRISTANPTLEPDDIGIILLDSARQSYELADYLQQTIARQFNWPVNKAYETKSKVPGHIFISNKNNVKGLEFPFVICVTSKISNSYSYRNALYMTLSRSFLKSYLILSQSQDAQVLSRVRAGLDVINSEGFIEVQPPTEEEKKVISTKIKRSSPQVSYYDFLESIFDELSVIPLFRDKLRRTVINTLGEDFDYNAVMEVADFNYQMMLKSGADEEI